MSYCIEIIVYTILPQHSEDFAAIKAQVAQEAHALPGLLSSTTQQSLEDSAVFVDTMVWDSEASARSSRDAFMKLPTTPAFLGMMAGPPVHEGRYTWSAGDTALSLVAK